MHQKGSWVWNRRSSPRVSAEDLWSMCIRRSFWLYRGTSWLRRRWKPLPRAVRGSGTCAYEPSSRADYDRTILMPVLAIIAMVLKTNRDAYENDQFSRSERS